MSVKSYIDFDDDFEHRELIDMVLFTRIGEFYMAYLFENMIVICPIPTSILALD